MCFFVVLLSEVDSYHHFYYIDVSLMHLQLLLEVVVGFFVLHHAVFQVSPTVIEVPVLSLLLWACVNLLFDEMQQLDPKVTIFMEEVGQLFDW